MKRLITIFSALIILTSCSAETTNDQKSNVETTTMAASVESTESAQATEANDATSSESDADSTVAQIVEDAEIELTLEELAEYNGKNGAHAYVAIKGIIYDVTNIPAWKEGNHNGLEAGKDLTKEMENAPHGFMKLEEMRPIGKVVE